MKLHQHVLTPCVPAYVISIAVSVLHKHEFVVLEQAENRRYEISLVSRRELIEIRGGTQTGSKRLWSYGYDLCN